MEDEGNIYISESAASRAMDVVNFRIGRNISKEISEVKLCFEP